MKIGRMAGLLVVAVSLYAMPLRAQSGSEPRADWQAKVNTMLPLLGHRNWILIVDSAYPLQTTPGVQTVETNSSELDVVKYVLNAVDHSIHVRPIVYMDAELPFVPESDAPGVTQYRRQVRSILGDRQVNALPHEQLIRKVDEVGKTFDILVLKTNLTIPYTSLFLRLDCRYWSADAEARLRKAMQHAAAAQH